MNSPDSLLPEWEFHPASGKLVHPCGLLTSWFTYTCDLKWVPREWACDMTTDYQSAILDWLNRYYTEDK